MCMNALRRRRYHCIHCDGTKGPCSCSFGCATKRRNHCKPCHLNVSCSNCGLVGLPGDRFKCRHCYDYDLCSGCYTGGAHDSNHAFMKMERAGIPPIFVPPRSGAPTQENIIMKTGNPPTPVFNPNPAVPQPALIYNTPQPSIQEVSNTIGTGPGFNHVSHWCNNLLTHYRCLHKQMQLQLSIVKMQSADCCRSLSKIMIFLHKQMQLQPSKAKRHRIGICNSLSNLVRHTRLALF